MQANEISTLDFLCSENTIEIRPDKELSLKSSSEWYKNKIFYHIWIRAFCDSNADGIGDLRGVIQKLDYIHSLGADAIWISPFFKCHGKGKNMHAYDVTDFYDVNPEFGTLEEIRELISEIHNRGMRIIFDFPMNHTSAYHPWFLDALQEGQYRNYYVWNKHPGKNWDYIHSEGGRGKETWHPHNGSFFYGVFGRYMPDLNYENVKVRDEICRILTYWLNFGFDGVRVDAARYIFEDGPKGIADVPRTHQFFKMVRSQIFDPYEKIGYMKLFLAEAWATKEIIRDYYDKEYHMCFNFPLATLIPNIIEGKSRRKFGETIVYQWKNYPTQYLGGIFLTNHDLAGDRPVTRFRGDLKKIELALAIQLFLPGTPFIYYGNEIGLPNTKASGDLCLRGDMNWELAKDEKNKVFAIHKKLIACYSSLFSEKEFLQMIFYEFRKGVLYLVRSNEKEEIHFLFNCSRRQRKINLKKINLREAWDFQEKQTLEKSEKKNIMEPFTYKIIQVNKK